MKDPWQVNANDDQQNKSHDTPATAHKHMGAGNSLFNKSGHLKSA